MAAAARIAAGAGPLRSFLRATLPAPQGPLRWQARCTTPAELAVREVAMGAGSGRVARLGFLAGDVLLENRAVAEGRYTRITNPAADIFCVMIFPEAALAAAEEPPIFAAEIVVIARKIRVAVIDLEHTDSSGWGSRTLAPELAALRNRHAPIAQSAEVPDWAKESFSAGVLLAREEPMEALPALEAAYRDYATLFYQKLLHAAGAADAAPAEPKATAQRAQGLARYKHHHATNSPGLPFLNKVFSAPWTEQFMAEGMYR